MTITLTLAPRDTKGGYYRFAHQGRSIYCPKAMFVGQPPATISITGEGFAEPKAAKVNDPEALQAAATKAMERAARAAEQAKKLAEKLEQLKAQQPAPPADKPAAKGRKAKAA